MKRTVAMFFVVAVALMVAPAAHASQYYSQVAGWIPWWSADSGIADASQHINKLTVIYPFAYEVNDDGTLAEKTDLNSNKWQNFFSLARRKRVMVMPTILWTNGTAMQNILGNASTRAAHVANIVAMVNAGRYDGVNVDYENKLAETKDSYSAFLKELKSALGPSRTLTCTVEARTPPDSLYLNVPSDIQYANDYAALNKYCDWVEIMTYDQQRADLKLNALYPQLPYAPIADTRWVNKVLQLAMQTIDHNKIMLGVATYGRAWDVDAAPDGGFPGSSYQAVTALDTPAIDALISKYHLTVGHTAGGDAVITYFPDTSVYHLLDQLPTPRGTAPGYAAAMKAALFAKFTKTNTPVRFVMWSDADAVAQKAQLAKQYNLRGFALFKIDGNEDQNIWTKI